MVESESTIALLVLAGIIILILITSDEFNDPISSTWSGQPWTKNHLLSASSDQFEEIVQALVEYKFEAGTAHVNLTGHNDRGLDIVVDPPRELQKNTRELPAVEGIDPLVIREKSGIECKRYSNENTVGRPIIQKANSAALERDCDRAIVVTTSRFTEEAKDSADSLDVDLINGNELLDQLNQSSIAPRKWN